MKSKDEETLWDVIVIGGGPAGMMAAATAAANNASVLLLEKNSGLGKKLRITGGGRCNVTNNKPDDREMLGMYKENGKFLFSTFSQHSVPDSVSWFTDRKVKLKEENEGRMFPVTDSADTIYETLLSELHKTSVKIISQAPITSIRKSDSAFEIKDEQGRLYKGSRCVIATGGTSRPETGSTGDGFMFAKELGHTVKKNDVALVPLITEERWVQEVSGVSLNEVTLTLRVDGTKEFKKVGKLLFTHKGVSGPTILNMSKQVGDLLESGTVTIDIDLLAAQDIGGARDTLTTLFHTHSNKKVKNVIGELVPTGLGRVLLKEAAIDEETPCHSVRVEEKKLLATLLKALPLTITGLMGKDKAVISSGGVALEEIDFRSMESKIAPGLYIVGDMLDIDRPSGGYSLQLCWSTGYVAGLHAAS